MLGNEPVRFGRGSPGRVQFHWRLAWRPTSLVGNYANAGQQRRPHGEPERVKVHDFKDKALGKAVPYGVYDLGRNHGWVEVGVDHETATFAVAATAPRSAPHSHGPCGNRTC